MIVEPYDFQIPLSNFDFVIRAIRKATAGPTPTLASELAIRFVFNRQGALGSE
jgi:hypothetical protein